MLSDIPGVSCVKPKGAIYLFPRLDPKIYPVEKDDELVLELLRQEKILLVHGTGFNWPDPDHLRIVTLPRVDDLTEAMTKVGNFLERIRHKKVF